MLHLASFGCDTDHLAARDLQLSRHVDQRDAVQAAREFVELIGGSRIIQRAQLLQFAQADGETHW